MFTPRDALLVTMGAVGASLIRYIYLKTTENIKSKFTNVIIKDEKKKTDSLATPIPKTGQAVGTYRISAKKLRTFAAAVFISKW